MLEEEQDVETRFAILQRRVNRIEVIRMPALEAQVDTAVVILTKRIDNLEGNITEIKSLLTDLIKIQKEQGK